MAIIIPSTRRGVYVQITYPSWVLAANAGGIGDIVLPYSTPNINHDSSQILSQPLPEIFAWLKLTGSDISKALKNSVASLIFSGVTAGAELAEILGVRLYNKQYFGSAWKGANPSEFSLTLDLKTGWKNEYSGLSEVVEPLKKLYKASLPGTTDSSGTGLLVSPGPTPLSVVGDFIKDYWNVASSEDKQLAAVASAIESVRANRDSGINAKGSTGAGKWKLEFAYFDGSSSKTFFKIKDLVLQSSGLKLDTSLMDSNGQPCAGTLNLAFKSSSITTDADVGYMFGE